MSDKLYMSEEMVDDVTQTKPQALVVEYDPIFDLLTIDGRKYRGEFFRYLHDNLPIGRKFEIVKREDNFGAVTIREVDFDKRLDEIARK